MNYLQNSIVSYKLNQNFIFKNKIYPLVKFWKIVKKIT